MKTFKFTADVLFQAEDISEALFLVAEHFKKISKFGESDFQFEGELEISVQEQKS
jgi:hypothetical protein